MNNLQCAQEYFEALNILIRRYMRNDVIFPLLLTNPKNTRINLDKAGCLYQCAMTSLHYSQFQRAAWYILALGKFLSQHFGEKQVDNAVNQARQVFAM